MNAIKRKEEKILKEFSKEVIGLPGTSIAKMRGTIYQVIASEIYEHISIYVELKDGSVDIVTPEQIGFLPMDSNSENFVSIDGEPIDFDTAEESQFKNKLANLKDKINKLFEQAENGEMTYELALSKISTRDILPETECVATIWSIEDLRNKFPKGTPDSILISALGDLSGQLQDAAVIAGHDVIADNLNPADFLEE